MSPVAPEIHGFPSADELTLDGKLIVQSGWLIVDTEAFAPKDHLILRASRSFDTSLLI